MDQALDEEGIVKLYLPFLQTYTGIPEREFIALPTATAADVRARGTLTNGGTSASPIMHLRAFEHRSSARFFL
jgi:hypothetical protein